jgi:hypothetical protein
MELVSSQWYLREQIIYMDGNQENKICPYNGNGKWGDQKF